MRSFVKRILARIESIRYFPGVTRLAFGAALRLENWRELIEGTRRERRGESVRETPVLRFRNGLELVTIRGGYGGFHVLFPEIFVHHCYRPTRRFSVRPGWTVVDIGANLGFFTCQAATAARDVRVVAVEPVSAYVEALRANLRRNGLDNVTPLHAAAVGEPGITVPITVWYTSSGAPNVTPDVPPGARVDTENVPGLTLAEIFERGRVERCDLLKMDIEGAEYPIFDATPREVWSRIDRVVMETHRVDGRSEAELAAILRDRGFDVTARGNLLWAARPHPHRGEAGFPAAD